MKKEITLGQLLSAGVTLLIALITGWVTLNNKISAHEIEIRSLKEKQEKTEVALDRIETKIDELNKTQTAILVKLENKKDRQ